MNNESSYIQRQIQQHQRQVRKAFAWLLLSSFIASIALIATLCTDWVLKFHSFPIPIIGLEFFRPAMKGVDLDILSLTFLGIQSLAGLLMYKWSAEMADAKKDLRYFEAQNVPPPPPRFD